MNVHEIMTAHARCVSPENTLVEAAGLMRELDCGALPVCEKDRLVGIITDRDMAVRAIAHGLDPNTTTVAEVMTPGVAYIMADASVEQAARMMQERGIRRLPVLNRARRIVGIVSLGDLAVSSQPAFSGITLREVSHPIRLNGRDRHREALGRSVGGLGIPRSNNGSEEPPRSAPKRRAARSTTARGGKRTSSSTARKTARSTSRSTRSGGRTKRSSSSRG